MLTDDGLVVDRAHPIGYDGRQRVYRWGWWGLSVISGPLFHAYPYAWEAAVMRFTTEAVFDDTGEVVDGELVQTELTDDLVEVFLTDEATNAFIAAARAWFEREMLERMSGAAEAES